MISDATYPRPRTLIIVPAHNEERNLPQVVSGLRVHAPWADIAVVDDGSTDRTAAVAVALGARVLKLPFNLGVGGAMQTGYLYAYESGYEVAVQFDGDGQHRAPYVPELVRRVAVGEADLAVGSRLLGECKYRFPVRRWVGSRILSGLVSWLFGVRVLDPTSGFRAASRRMVKLFAHHYPQTYLGDTVEALAIAARHGMRIREVPVRMRRANGSSIGDWKGILHTLRVCLAILIDRVERPLPVGDIEAMGGEVE